MAKWIVLFALASFIGIGELLARGEDLGTFTTNLVTTFLPLDLGVATGLYTVDKLFSFGGFCLFQMLLCCSYYASLYTPCNS